jgi:SAM-dependent methyltransferase
VWTDRTVAWYERANARSDYAARVLEAAAPALEGAGSAVDVGAGFGALTIPLARRLPAVTALEPSPAMVRALRAALRRERLDHVRVVPAAWAPGVVAPHDVVLCAHVGPLLRRGSTFLAAIPSLARRAAVLVHDAPGGDDKFFFPELYPVLKGRPYERRTGFGETQEALADLGITPAVTVIEYDSDQPFTDLDEACDFWMTYLELQDARSRAFLRDFLARRLRRDDGGWLAPYHKRATVFTWRV